jgi:hypothetical protein
MCRGPLEQQYKGIIDTLASHSFVVRMAGQPWVADDALVPASRLLSLVLLHRLRVAAEHRNTPLWRDWQTTSAAQDIHARGSRIDAVASDDWLSCKAAHQPTVFCPPLVLQMSRGLRWV